MNTAKEQIRSDMEKSPDELQREADEVRRDMEQTVDQLANQFSPGELINQTFKKLQNGSGTAFAHNLSTQIQNNPIPALLAGVSLAWLMTASKRAPVQTSSNDTHSGVMGAGKDKLSSAAAHTRNSGQHMVDGVKDKQQHLARSASDMKHRVSESSHHLMDSARSGAHTARSQYEHMLQEQPLVLGMLAIAAGAAMGALLPRTEQEDRAMGETSDEQKAAIKHRAESLKEQAEAKVSEKVQDGQQHQSQSSSSPSTDATRAGHSNHSPSSTSPTSSTSSTSSTHEKSRQHERGTPAANPTAAPNHPATNPPVVNPSDSREG